MQPSTSELFSIMPDEDRAGSWKDVCGALMLTGLMPPPSPDADYEHHDLLAKLFDSKGDERISAMFLCLMKALSDRHDVQAHMAQTMADILTRIHAGDEVPDSCASDFKRFSAEQSDLVDLLNTAINACADDRKRDMRDAISERHSQSNANMKRWGKRNDTEGGAS